MLVTSSGQSVLLLEDVEFGSKNYQIHMAVMMETVNILVLSVFGSD